MRNFNLALFLAFVLMLAVGYAIGYVSCCNQVLKTAQGWKEMYEEHISKQWEMIQKRDSLYVNALQLQINYTDGHTLTPND